MMTTGAIRRAKLQSKCDHQQTNTQCFTGQMPYLSPNQQCQITEGKMSVESGRLLLLWFLALVLLSTYMSGLFVLFGGISWLRRASTHTAVSHKNRWTRYCAGVEFVILITINVYVNSVLYSPFILFHKVSSTVCTGIYYAGYFWLPVKDKTEFRVFYLHCYSWTLTNAASCRCQRQTTFSLCLRVIVSEIGVLASEGWWEAWQPSPKVTRSY